MLRTVTWYVTDWPARAPSVCADGAAVRPCGGAIGVTCGLADVPTPCADVTSALSLTIDCTLFDNDGEIRTVNVTEVLPPAGTVSPDQLTRPFASVPPSLAETNDVLTGSRS